MNPQVSSEATNAYNQSQALQSQYNSQIPGAVSQYNTSVGGANSAQSALQNFTGNMVQGGNYYNQQLAQAQNQYGFNPASLATADQNLISLQNQMANLPQNAAQIGGGYGVTGGQAANIYSGLQSQLQPAVTNQTNTVANYQNLLAATQNQANQATGAQLTGQGQQLQGYTSAATNASTIMQNSLTAMNNIETLAQQQGLLTAQQQAQYAAAQQSYAAASNALAQEGLYGAQAQQAQAQAGLYGSEATYQGLQNTAYEKSQTKASTPSSSSGLSVNSAGNVNNVSSGALNYY